MNAHEIIRKLAEHGIRAQFAGIVGKPGRQRQVFLIDKPLEMRLSVPLVVDWRTSVGGGDAERYDREVEPALATIFGHMEAT
jgi:hypothetical protein